MPFFHDASPAKNKEVIMENSKNLSGLDGKWRIVRKFIGGYAVGQSLTFYKDYTAEFAVGGTLIETHGAETITATYSFDPAARTVNIQPLDRLHANSVFGAGGAIFRVVPLNGCEISLRKPHNAETGGELETILLERME
jgi:hypothetical protein